MAFDPIRLRLNGEEIHVVADRDVHRWSGWFSARRAAFALMSPVNARPIRDALFVPEAMQTQRVFVELTKQLEDGSAFFFELPMPSGSWHQHSKGGGGGGAGGGGGGGTDRPTEDKVHWIEVVCVNDAGQAFVGASAEIQLPDGRKEFVKLDGRSSVRFDDLSEGGSAHFELDQQAEPQGTALDTPTETYTLGQRAMLRTRKRHVLRVTPNPDAWVGLEVGQYELLASEADDGAVGSALEFVFVELGEYALRTSKGEDVGQTKDGAAEALNLRMPSEAEADLRDIILAPRAASEDDEDGEDGGKTKPIPGEARQVAPHDILVTVHAPGGESLEADINMQDGARSQDERGVESLFENVDGAVTLTLTSVKLATPQGDDSPDDGEELD